ncbi:MAG: hypothetical protein DRN71_04880 [Candidatus Nanohalarchaeota archaeon]|nr:MAG: hypothetical protein DRN71_04880 [Candidatus Nanohaloarchaeota archaeon]
MGDDLSDERLREWVVSRYRDGYSVDAMRGILVGLGYNVVVVDELIETVIRECDVSAEEQSFRLRGMVKEVRAELGKWSIKEQFQKIEYVLAYPLNFIDEIREIDGANYSKAIVYVLLNICFYSFFKSVVGYVFGGSLLYFVVNVLYFVLLGAVSFAVSGYVVHWIIRKLGGKGSFWDTVQVFAYAWSVIVFAPLPYLWVLPAIYGVVSGIFNLSLVHKVNKKIAGIAVGVPLGVVTITGLILYVIVSV